jgi:phosphoribosylformylglycinamidine synthase I
MSTARALVLRAPGINCDRETALGCRLAGFETERVHINQLIREPEQLLRYHFLVIPGGFSYGDDLGAGTLLAQNLNVHLAKELQHFIDEGRPVLGICNGFQVLVRAGLLPGLQAEGERAPRATLTENASAHYECRWVTLAATSSPCIFTRALQHPFELPIGHGAGRFVLANPVELERLQTSGQIALVYTMSTRQASPSPAASTSTRDEVPYPANPNGSLGAVAGVCNAQGNVLGMMPHPDRYLYAALHPRRRSTHGDGDGRLIFQQAYAYVQEREECRRKLPVSRKSEPGTAPLSYAASGVDIAAAESALHLIKDAVRATHGPQVQAGLGAFAGVFEADALKEMRRPALVASTDGVGTKTLLASQTGRFETIGHDLVNHAINDLLTQRATPLFFMDYIATGKLAPAQMAAVVRSVAAACTEVGCALLGGEMAEMPDVYHAQTFDLAGTIVGAVDLAEGWCNGADIEPGDMLLGLPSSGLHTNGYTLARRVFADCALETVLPELGESLADALLRPHRCYLRELQLIHRHVHIKGLAHITGGGFASNISRMLPAGTRAVIETHAWQVPPLFSLIARQGKIARPEMYQTFNMGTGMVLALAPALAEQACRILPELLVVGTIVQGEGVILKHEGVC